MRLHEFLCPDCRTDVHSWGEEPAATKCYACLTVDEMKANNPQMTAAQEATLREILCCVIPVNTGA